MSQEEPTEALISVLKRKKLDSLVNEIHEGITTYQECLNRTKDDWKELYGPAIGFDIYNFLHPQGTTSDTIDKLQSLFSDVMTEDGTMKII